MRAKACPLQQMSVTGACPWVHTKAELDRIGYTLITAGFATLYNDHVDAVAHLRARLGHENCQAFRFRLQGLDTKSELAWKSHHGHAARGWC